MPTWYSVKAAQGLEFRRGGYGTVKDPVLGEQTVAIKPLMVRFRELYPPIPVYGLPGRDGLARGILTPEDAVAQIRTRASEFGASGDNLPKTDEDLAKWVCQKMSDHRMKGALFVEVLNYDEDADGEPMDDNLAPPPGMVTSPVGVITRSGTRAYCHVCDRSLRPQGINGHSKSNKHLENLRAYEDSLRERTAVA